MSYFLCPGEEVDSRESPDYHLLPELLHEAPAGLGFLPGRDAGTILYHVLVVNRYFPWSFGFLFWYQGGTGSGGKGVRSDTFICINYFSFSSCLVDIQLVNKLLGIFSHFSHCEWNPFRGDSSLQSGFS